MMSPISASSASWRPRASAIASSVTSTKSASSSPRTWGASRGWFRPSRRPNALSDTTCTAAASLSAAAGASFPQAPVRTMRTAIFAGAPTNRAETPTAVLARIEPAEPLRHLALERAWREGADRRVADEPSGAARAPRRGAPGKRDGACRARTPRRREWDRRGPARARRSRARTGRAAAASPFTSPHTRTTGGLTTSTLRPPGWVTRSANVPLDARGVERRARDREERSPCTSRRTGR